MAHTRSSVRRSPRNQISLDSEAKAIPMLSADLCVNYDICLKHGTRNCGICAKEKSPETKIAPKKHVITPSFRPAPFYSNSSRNSFKRPLRYIKCNSPIIEYDCSDRDYLFIDLMNEEICDLSSEVPTLEYQEVERVIDSLENLAFYSQEFFQVIQEMRKRKTKHNRCCICVSTRNEELLQCNKCSIFVHLSCYRSSDVCMDGEWLCDWCQFTTGFEDETQPTPQCALCSQSGGAMKRTDRFESWCHVVCFENHPSTSFDKLSLLVTGLETSPLPSWFTHCSVCETLDGSPIQCMEDSCTTPIHLYCSHKQIQQLFSSGLYEDSPFNQLFLTCTKHTWMKWIQTRLTSCQCVLSDDQVDMINEEIISRGGEQEVPDVVLSLIFEYWNLLMNPTFPEKFLLPSLSVAKNMERMEERWEELEGSTSKKSQKSRRVKKRSPKARYTPQERKRQARTYIRAKKRVTCKISRRKPRHHFKSGIVPFTIPVSSNVSLNAPEGSSFCLSASAFTRNFDATIQQNKEKPPVTITVSVNGIKSQHCAPKRRHSYFTRRKTHPPNHWSALRAKQVGF